MGKVVTESGHEYNIPGMNEPEYAPLQQGTSVKKLIGVVSGQYIPVMISEATRGNEDRTSLITSGLFLAMGFGRMTMPLCMGAISATSLFTAMLIPAAVSLLCALCCHLAIRSK